MCIEKKGYNYGVLSCKENQINISLYPEYSTFNKTRYYRYTKKVITTRQPENMPAKTFLDFRSFIPTLNTFIYLTTLNHKTRVKHIKAVYNPHVSIKVSIKIYKIHSWMARKWVSMATTPNTCHASRHLASLTTACQSHALVNKQRPLVNRSDIVLNET